VNSLVWALLFVAVFGPGALAGALAIACRSIGFVGKLLLPRRSRRPSASPIEALTAAVRRAAAMLAQGLLAAGRAARSGRWRCSRWDINVRESAVLGLVGAGGIGVALDSGHEQPLLGPGRALILCGDLRAW
jgi:phosphonate transport system permease protein